MCPIYPATHQYGNFVFAAIVSVLIGIGFGLSYGFGSNQFVYLPPGLMESDPSLWSQDWWAQNAVHYHKLFSLLVKILDHFHVLPWALAILNTLAVAATLMSVAALFLVIAPSVGWLSWYLFLILFTLTESFYSVATTFLFGWTAEPSTFATVFLFVGIASYVAGRHLVAGIFIALSGAFHTNFLFCNLLLFGFSECISLFAWRDRGRPTVVELLRRSSLVLVPSIIVLLLQINTIIDIISVNVSPEVRNLASWIFLNFAVPFHYLPSEFLDEFYELAGWQLLALGTSYFLPMTPQTKTLLRLLAGTGIIIWIATALTTIVFFEPVSRLFLWRLAPISVALSAIIFLSGSMLGVTTDNRISKFHRLCTVSLLLLGFILITITRWLDRGDSFLNEALLLGILGGVIVVLLVRTMWHQSSRPTFLYLDSARRTGILIFSLIITFSFLAIRNHQQKYERYNLVFKPTPLAQELALMDWVRDNTPKNAVFLVPPALKSFRLLAERAIIIDMKALPHDPKGVIEWRMRLGEISGHPELSARQSDINIGYKTMNIFRLEALRCRYGTNWYVRNKSPAIDFPNWNKVYENNEYEIYTHSTGGC